MITLEMKIDEYVKFLETRVDLPCDNLNLLRKLPPNSVIKDLTDLIDDGKIAWENSFHMWALTDHGDQMDETMRTIMLCRFTSPTLAFMAYMNLPFLTDKEDEELVIIFEDWHKLAYNKVLSGKLRRKKDG